MSTAYAQPDLREYVTRLSPAQEHHLRLIINNDAKLPPLTPEAPSVEDDPILALIGSIKDTDIPSDYAENSGEYAQAAAWRRHLESA